MISVPRKNNFTNYKKVVKLANGDWQSAQQNRILGLNVNVSGPNHLTDQYDREFYHFCTTSYLGLDYHPALLEGAVRAIRETGTLRIANSKNRCKLAILEHYEQALSSLFDAHCLTTLSCSSASSGILPLLASGLFTANSAPCMVFDRHAHYSMNHMKASCADETEVITAPHNDMNYLEDICKRKRRVAFIADGVYSMGGVADIQSIIYLHERYGLFLYLDDSHSLSALGENGRGYVRSLIGALDHNMIIVASLAKSFGSSGGLVMFGDRSQHKLVHRYGGPSNWSQSINVAAIGAGLASIKIHASQEINCLQRQLQQNIRHFDSLVHTKQSSSPTAIRLIPCGQASLANQAAAYLADNGFFCSAVFFPTVAQDQAALRVTLRADISLTTITRFCALLSRFMHGFGRDISRQPQAPL